VLGTGGEVFDAYHKLSQLVASDEPEVNIIEAVDNLARIVANHAPQFKSSQAADACEFLLFLLDALHEDVNRVLKKGYGAQEPAPGMSDAELVAEAMRVYKMRNDSYVSDQTLGLFKSCVTCMQCQRRSELMETSMFTSLSIPPGVTETTLDKCFELYSSVVELSGDNAYFCRTCLSHVTAQRQMLPYSYPEILIVHLRRAVSGVKKETKVEFPLKDLCPPCSGPKSTYDLFAICNHAGSATLGTNSSFVKLNDGWHTVSWTDVSTIAEDQLVSPDAYLLFYIKKN
jgi:ubiquitin C-terminal hydrolase